MKALGYPVPVTDKIPDITEARNIELGLGLQVITPYLWSDNLSMCMMYNVCLMLDIDQCNPVNQENLRQFLNQMQLCLLHPSKYKFEHPRFCYERLEYLGQKIQVRSFTCIKERSYSFLSINILSSCGVRVEDYWE